MCGITGILNPAGDEPVERRLLQQMTDALAHRGPDASGLLLRGSAGLGHRRLSIIDLATGEQPMGNEDGSVSVAFNGEIFNYAELRRELVARGHVFRTDSDTEVIVHQYEEDGADCVRHFRGMFAFAIWDERRQELLLARDRFGIKPLFVAEQAGRVAFASEIKALLLLPWVDRSWNPSALRNYLGLGYISGPRTAYNGIRRFDPGSVEVWRRDGDRGWRARASRYWSPTGRRDSPPPSYEAAKERVFELLVESVRLRLRSDVPLGAFLSGGVDSTAIVALMRMCGVKDLKTFSIGFEESGYDEAPFASAAARHLGTEHHAETVTAADALLLRDLLGVFDEPFGDDSAIPTYLVSRLARERVTVSLSGDGGDELFAGYHHYRRMRRFLLVDRLPLSVRRPLARLGTRVLPVGVKGGGFVRELHVPAQRRILWLASRGPDPLVAAALGSGLAAFLDEAGSDDEWQEAFLHESSVTNAQLVDQSVYLPDDILVKVDRCSMAVSLEARVPLLDHKLAEYVNSLPAAYKMDGQVAKRIFKDVMKPYVPADTISREKRGFSVPLRAWLTGPLKGWVHEILLERSDGLFDGHGVRRLLETMPGGGDEASKQVWSLLSLAVWADGQATTPW